MWGFPPCRVRATSQVPGPWSPVESDRHSAWGCGLLKARGSLPEGLPAWMPQTPVMPSAQVQATAPDLLWLVLGPD